MNDADKTKAQLLEELTMLRQRNAVLEASVQAQQQMEEALGEEERHRILIEGSLQGISVFNLEGIRLFANQALATMLGYEHLEPLIGKRADSHLSPHEAERLESYRHMRLQGQPVPSRYEVEGIRRDGKTIWMEQLVSPITWNHEPALLIATVDITERKQLESQLRQTQKIEAMGTLAGGIAHDFNNFFAVLFLHTELVMCDAEPSSELWESLQVIQNMAERAKDLVHQILTFSRQVETKRQSARVSVVIKETLGLLRASLPATIKIEQTFPDAGDMIMIDPSLLQQIMLNLFANTEYAMRDSGDLLTIRVDVVEIDNAVATTLPCGSYVRLSIRDSGHGMTPDVVERIFDPFFTTKEVGEGTGMGLAVVHGIVTQSDGDITVDSTPGDGTLFTLYFPRLSEDEPGSTSDPNTRLRGTGRLLLVDDEAMLTQGIHKLLEQLGYEVVSHTSSLKALEIFQGDPYSFDLIITDQTMPHMTGDKLVQAVRRIRTDMPIILCTGFSHIMDHDKARALGVDAFCLKPLTVQELGSTIQHVLRRRAAQTPPLPYQDMAHFRSD